MSAPGWRNWQTQRTQNPPILAIVGVRPPLPAPRKSSVQSPDMLSADLRPGTEYAFREKRIAGTPLHRICLVEHIRRDKWKAKWIDPNPGLVDYVTTAQVMVPWKEHKAFLRDE